MQIGDHLDSVPRKILMQCLNDYIRVMNDWSKSHGMPFVILDVALHMDETTPHVHIRRVWNGHDKDGNLIPNQNDALKRAGVELPDPSKQEGRYNNRKMAFDAWAREQWQQIIKVHGIEIETVPIKGRRHLDKDDCIREQAAQAMALRDRIDLEGRDIEKRKNKGASERTEPILCFRWRIQRRRS